MRTSDTVREVAKALAVASKTMGHAGKDRQNPHLRNRYATLEAVIDAVRIPLRMWCWSRNYWPTRKNAPSI